MLLLRAPITNPTHPVYGTYCIWDCNDPSVLVNDGASAYGLSLDDVQAYVDQFVSGDKALVDGQPMFSDPIPSPVVESPAKEKPGWLTRAGRWLAGFGM